MDSSIQNHLTTFLVNGAIGLVLALVLIRVFARVFDKAANHLIGSVDRSSAAEVAELRELRADIRTAGQQTASAIGLLTDRVSRIEGKIEGIALVRDPEMSDQYDDDLTPVGVEPPNGDLNTPVRRRPGPRPRAVTPPAGVRKPRNG